MRLPCFLWRIWTAGKPRRAPAVSQALIGRYETACIPWIPMVAEFCTDHIEKAIFVTLTSIFSETVEGMKLKFGEEIEKKLIYQDPSPFRWDFQYFCVNSILKWRRSRLTAAKLQALSGNPKTRKPESGIRIPEPESGIRNPESGIGNQNPESGIRYPESTNQRARTLQKRENYLA